MPNVLKLYTTEMF